MSTQDDSGISFEISNEQQNFRLLELPSSLLALIVSKDPPKYVLSYDVRDMQDVYSANVPESLWLKSAEPPTANVDSSPSAVLCTDDRTYQLRQVQSSNSLYVLQPSESRYEDDRIPSQNLSAIAQCTSTLELIPSDTGASFAFVSQFLKKRLPPYKGTDTDMDLGSNTTISRKSLDRNAILQDAPFSTNEFNETWKQLCAFETLGCAWLPTPSALAMVWKSILSAATVRGVNLEKNFELHSLAEMVGNDGYPWALLMAVVTRLVCDTDAQKNGRICLSRERTIQWVGIICVQKAGESIQAKGLAQSDFLAQWHDLLPEGWRRHASMDLLKARYSHLDTSKEMIVFSDDIYDPISLDILPTASSSGKPNRKWHEKFKVGRK